MPSNTSSPLQRTWQSSWEYMWRERSAAPCYALAGLLAVAMLAHLFPFDFLAGKAAFFERGDPAQHVSGWLFYVRDAWHFPLLHTERLNHPVGINIAFTDSIPLAALLFKTIRSLLPEGFHYIGWWHALVFITQAFGATFLIRSLGVRHLFGAACAVAFALMWPALLWRLGHTSLMTHGLLLFSLGVYFNTMQKRWQSGTASAILIAASAVGLMVHPYLLAFCYAIFVALLIDLALHGEGWRPQLLRLPLSLAVLALLGVALGYFGNGTTATGYGFYSMNLDAPFCGSRFFSCASDPAAHQFAAYHFDDATGGQYEGFNYFGLGLLMLLPFGIAAGRQSLAALPFRHGALLLICILLSAYAVSNKAYFGTSPVLDFALPSSLEKLTGTFRAGGRFFWIVGYLILFACLAALLKKPSWRGLLVLLFALPLQWMDVQPLRDRIIGIAGAPSVNEAAKWQKTMANVDELNIYPAYGCGANEEYVYGYFQMVAAQYGKLLDTGHIARAGGDCGGNAHAFDTPLKKRHLYLMSAELLKNPFAVPRGFHLAAERGECVRWREVVLCAAGTNDVFWQNAGLTVTPVPPLDTTRRTWAAAEFETLIGTMKIGRLVPKSPEAGGFLSFGPYITLLPGQYHYTIRYASNAPREQAVGSWDVMLTDPSQGARQAAVGELHGTGGEETVVEGQFTVDHWSRPVEIRTQYARGDLQLIDVSLGKVR